MNNKDEPMSKEQLELREYLIETGRFPENLNVLIINAAYETSINIDEEV